MRHGELKAALKAFAAPVAYVGHASPGQGALRTTSGAAMRHGKLALGSELGGTGMVPPDRLVNGAPTQLRAFLARSPLLTAQQRLPSAMVAAGLGVFSSQTMVDLYSQIYDTTDPTDLGDSDAWQLRQAYVGKDEQTRLAAVRKLLGSGKDALQKEAVRALVARAATFITPSADLASDAPELI